MTDDDAKMDLIRDPLAEAGTMDVYTDEQGREARRLMAKGEQVGRQLVFSQVHIEVRQKGRSLLLEGKEFQLSEDQHANRQEQRVWSGLRRHGAGS